ncbi:efflux RND transporter periplasmic adaptor subunit [Brevibacillus invocatus]|uniref:Efflux RND transporter periplasmic adaptor subunit n=1 Tax=Brevibacillus invocatus TaxID=173959 RepID=A0A3M8CJG1_9BACL|nr:efflux RND transporter periplasmic adaptor subunit [Brevibacillus invocatus]RNB75820.1 efflux RND transporter periplasmic adaptor subunit [Brevibacillus invocatus]
MKKARWLIPIVMVGILATTACSNSQETAFLQKETKSVVVKAVKKEQLQQVSELSATLQPKEEALVSFEVGGRIVELERNEGDNVKAGDLLARVNDKDYELQVAASNAVVQQSAASMNKVQNGAREQEVTQAVLVVEKATIAFEQAQEDFQRIEKLYQEKAISKSDFENMQNRLSIAQKDLENAKQAYSMITQGARAEDKNLSQASYQHAVVSQETASNTLAKTNLHSPIHGTILAKLSSAGNLVSPGTPIYQVGNIDQLKVVLPVPDREIANWKVGEVITFDLYGQKRDGKVVNIYPTTNKSTGTIGVEVQIENPAHDWFAGQVVKAIKPIDVAAGIYVPVESVISRGKDNAHVFLIKDGKAVKTNVEIGRIVSNKLEIRSGLTEGEQLIVKGVDRLFDGDAVETMGGTPQ